MNKSPKPAGQYSCNTKHISVGEQLYRSMFIKSLGNPGSYGRTGEIAATLLNDYTPSPPAPDSSIHPRPLNRAELALPCLWPAQTGFARFLSLQGNLCTFSAYFSSPFSSRSFASVPFQQYPTELANTRAEIFQTY